MLENSVIMVLSWTLAGSVLLLGVRNMGAWCARVAQWLCCVLLTARFFGGGEELLIL